MPQVQPIYLPTQRRKTLSSDIGGLLGAAIGYTMQEKADTDRKEEVQQFVEAIRKAPDRAAAFEVVSNHTAKFKTAGDHTKALQYVDEMHPASMETPTPVTAFGPDGKKTMVFPTRAQMSDSKYWKNSGVTLIEPDMVEYFMPIPGLPATHPDADPNARPMFEQVGKFPIGKRPSGALTKDEIGLAYRDEAAIRADAAANRSEKRLQQGTERMEAAQQRTQEILGRMAAASDDRASRAGQSSSTAFTRLAAVSLNGRILPDGTFDFAGDVDKADQFTKMIEYWNTRIEQNPKLLKSPTAVTKIFAEARRSVIPPEPKESAKATPVKEEGGISALSRKIGEFFNSDKKVEKPQEKSKPVKKVGMTPADVQSGVKSAKEAAARVRASGLSVPEKKKLLDTIRARLKEAGINEEI